MNNQFLNCQVRDYKLMEQRYKSMQIYTHDIKKHFSLIKNYLNENGDLDKNKILEVNSYIDRLEKSVDNISCRYISSNAILNTILNEKQRIAAVENILMETFVETKELDFIDDIDLCTIFSNLLDNAVESCLKSHTKKIKLNVYTINNNSFLFIKLINSCNVEPIITDGKLQTCKNSQEMHGYGMESINNILKKYKGNIQWKFDDKKMNFTTFINIPICYRKK